VATAAFVDNDGKPAGYCLEALQHPEQPSVRWKAPEPLRPEMWPTLTTRGVLILDQEWFCRASEIASSIILRGRGSGMPTAQAPPRILRQLRSS
jgi:hypothetical protein